MRHPIIYGVLAVVLTQIDIAIADPLLDATQFKKEMEDGAQKVADIVIGNAEIVGANNKGTNGPCNDPKHVGIGTDQDYYCVKVTMHKKTYVTNGEIDNGLSGINSFNAMQKGILAGQAAYQDLRNVVVESLTKPIFDSWRDNRSSVEAVDARITTLESRLPEITLGNMEELIEKLHLLEKKVDMLESKLRDLEQK